MLGDDFFAAGHGGWNRLCGRGHGRFLGIRFVMFECTTRRKARQACSLLGIYARTYTVKSGHGCRAPGFSI
jgi:hypothetical protein